MQLLREVLNMGSTREEMVHLWILYCRSVAEQSCVVWGSSLTLENSNDIERTQKSFAKLVLKEDYTSYRSALIKLNLKSLSERRKFLALRFAENSIKHNKLNDLFPLNPKRKQNITRKIEIYKVIHANTHRLQKSAIIDMQNLLNEKDLMKKGTKKKDRLLLSGDF